MNECANCGKPLTGGIDTFGEPNGDIFCHTCWSDISEQVLDDFYGVAPHVHDLTKTGSFIGSTVLIELPKPDESGWIDLAPLGGWYVDWMYREDEEGPGCGVYNHKRNFDANS